jgi:hypothetical protein
MECDFLRRCRAFLGQERFSDADMSVDPSPGGKVLIHGILKQSMLKRDSARRKCDELPSRDVVDRTGKGLRRELARFPENGESDGLVTRGQQNDKPRALA